MAHHFPVPLKSQSGFNPPATLLGTPVEILNKPSLTFPFNKLPACLSLFVCALQNRLDIKNGSILRLTKAPVSLRPAPLRYLPLTFLPRAPPSPHFLHGRHRCDVVMARLCFPPPPAGPLR